MHDRRRERERACGSRRWTAATRPGGPPVPPGYGRAAALKSRPASGTGAGCGVPQKAKGLVPKYEPLLCSLVRVPGTRPGVVGGNRPEGAARPTGSGTGPEPVLPTGWFNGSAAALVPSGQRPVRTCALRIAAVPRGTRPRRASSRPGALGADGTGPLRSRFGRLRRCCFSSSRPGDRGRSPEAPRRSRPSATPCGGFRGTEQQPVWRSARSRTAPSGARPDAVPALRPSARLMMSSVVAAACASGWTTSCSL